jgi:hypothetical protein
MKTFEHVKVGDVGTRMLAGTVPMQLEVTEVDEKLIHCGEWMFDRLSGVEHDPELGWGVEFGVSGSYLVPEDPRDEHRELVVVQASEISDTTNEVLTLALAGEAEGAIPNGARVRKRRDDVDGEGSLPVGALGTVYSSFAVPLEELHAEGHETYEGDEHAYFIVWDDLGPQPVFTRGYKVEAA